MGNQTSAYREGNSAIGSFPATSSEESNFWMNLKKKKWQTLPLGTSLVITP